MHVSHLIRGIQVKKPPFLRNPPLFVQNLKQGGVLKILVSDRKFFGGFPLVLLHKTRLKRCFCKEKCILRGLKSQNFPPAAGYKQHSYH